jgi:hypothetical protein
MPEGEKKSIEKLTQKLTSVISEKQKLTLKCAGLEK